ncbi:ABC-three component system protein [Stenoxybacter acetivorans]|uniref:ABC-three component system protein n=1 Tax=Stenoxybacter acetivorans TaxID=422441 RepID=UPI0005619340|nr:ABC-three component system protein [Stenoxybacter acetivorans]
MSYQATTNHSAEAVALGFYYQTFYALLALLEEKQDDVAVCLERLDDVEIDINGQKLLYQLKHSFATSKAPNAITITSKILWKTLKAWIDILPRLAIDETIFQLITVAPLNTELAVLLNNQDDRSALCRALAMEAQRVCNGHQSSSGDNPSRVERIKCCKAYLSLTETERQTLLNRVRICASQGDITTIEGSITEKLIYFPPEQRPVVAKRLIEWWDRQTIYTLCGKRERFIAKIELQEKISEIVGEIERDELLPEFELLLPPENHQPDSLLIKQIDLVKGKPSDINKAIREEWRAREQRHKWISTRLDMAERIDRYDRLLKEKWADKHQRMVEDCEDPDETIECKQGLELLRWSHDKAYLEIHPFAPNWNAEYYIQGSYQVLAINLEVGWHPKFKELLGKPI